MVTFHLKVMTVDHCFYDGEGDRIIIRTTQGDAGILPGADNRAADWENPAL